MKSPIIPVTKKQKKYLELFVERLNQTPDNEIYIEGEYFICSKIATSIKEIIDDAKYHRSNSYWLNEVRDWYINQTNESK